MQTEHADQSFFLAARLVDNSQHDDAITVLRPLLECELDAMVKSMVCINMAIIHGLKGQDSDALIWYDRGIGYERSLGRFFVAERKAAFMAEKNWNADSLTMYERLLNEPSLTGEDRERIEQNISLLKERLGY
ncbi:MAG TPA: hypothetical protein VGB76_21985 [Pyrinomonadaceae bacterium]|jgi:hypothetical protein